MSRTTYSRSINPVKKLVAILLILLLATTLFVSLRMNTQAVSGVIQFEAESSSRTGGASIGSDTNASGGQFIQYTSVSAN